MLKVVFVLLVLCSIGWSFRMSSGFLRLTRKQSVITGDIDAKPAVFSDTKQSLVSDHFQEKDVNIAESIPAPIDVSPVVLDSSTPASVSAVASETEKEKLHKTYPNADLELPMLDNCNNFYSGTFKNMFWHQNGDNFFLFIPITEDIARRDIDVKFEALSVVVKIRGELVTQFPTEHRIIPAGSFWLFDRDKHGQRYLHLDLEKRYRMINWNHLFGEPEKLSEEEQKKAKAAMLARFTQQNKEIAKSAGLDVGAEESEGEPAMRSDAELRRIVEEAESDALDELIDEEAARLDGNKVNAAGRENEGGGAEEVQEKDDFDYKGDLQSAEEVPLNSFDGTQILAGIPQRAE